MVGDRLQGGGGTGRVAGTDLEADEQPRVRLKIHLKRAWLETPMRMPTYAATKLPTYTLMMGDQYRILQYETDTTSLFPYRLRWWLGIASLDQIIDLMRNSRYWRLFDSSDQAARLLLRLVLPQREFILIKDWSRHVPLDLSYADQRSTEEGAEVN